MSRFHQSVALTFALILPHPSARHRNRALRAQVGTIQYMAPEVLKGDYSTPADVWSLGVIAYQMLSGEMPWTSNNVVGIINEIGAGKYGSFNNFHRYPRWKSASEESKDFCKQLLRKDAAKRPSAPEALLLPFLSKTTSTSSAMSSAETVRESNLFRKSGSKLLAYAKMPQLQKIATLMVAHDCQAFPEQIKELRALFMAYDKDNCGAISLDEFKAAFLTEADSMTPSLDTSTINEIFDGMDAYKDGKVSYTEFIAAALTVFGFVTEDRLVEAFEDQLDIDGSGTVTMDNLKNVLGRDFNDETATKMINHLDTNKSGDISLEEFLTGYQKTMDSLVGDALPDNTVEIGAHATARISRVLEIESGLVGTDVLDADQLVDGAEIEVEV